MLFRSFQACTSLGKNVDKEEVSIVLNDNLTAIGDYAFSSCSALKNINIVNETIKLGAGVFSGCTNLQYISIPDTITYIPVEFLKATPSLLEFEFPTAITEIRENAFENSGLVDLKLSECTQLVKIGKYAFTAADLSGKVVLPEGLKEIMDCAFNASSIIKIEFPSSVDVLGNSIFANCNYLEKFTMYNQVPSIPARTFFNNFELNDITIKKVEGLEDKLVSIGKNAFSGCGSLPNTDFLCDLTSLVELEDSAFASCYYEINGDETRDIYGNKKKYSRLKVVKLPSSVTEFGKGVFKDCIALNEVYIDNTGLEELPESTFEGCSDLNSILLPKNLKEIGKSAFADCKSLMNVDFGQEPVLEIIRESAFKGAGELSKASEKAAKAFVNDMDDLREVPSPGFIKVYCLEDMVWNGEKSKPVINIQKDLSTQSDGVGDGSEEQTEEQKEKPKVSYSELKTYYVDPLLLVKGDNTEYPIYIPVETGSTLTLNEANVPVYEKYELPSVERYAMTENFNYFEAAINMAIVDFVGYEIRGLDYMSVPDSVTTIEQSAFENCVNLSYLKLPENEEYIVIAENLLKGASVRKMQTTAEYDDATAGQKDPLTDDPMEIDAYYGLKTVVMPNQIQEIMNSAFESCY